MYPTLPVGPFALPTSPFLTIIAAVVGLEIMGRYGRRAKLSPDDLWNVGLAALLGGLIVARLWNVVRFWAVYSEEPNLIISLRPSGFEVVPGVIFGLLAAMAFMIWRRMEPIPVIACALIGIVAGAVITSVAGYLAGTTSGIENLASWYLNPLDPYTHPAGLYRAAGMFVLLFWLLIWTTPLRPVHAIGWSLLGFGVVRLVADGFIANAETIGSLRVSQVVGMGIAITGCLVLGRNQQHTAAQN